MSRHNERPSKRVNPSGKTVWVARFTDRNGRRSSAGTFPLKGPCKMPLEDGSCCAQHAIEAAYDRERSTPTPRRGNTVGDYASTWTQRRPRSPRTNASYEDKLKRVLDVQVQGRAFRDWPLPDVRRRHVNDLVDHMLRVQGRAQKGAVGVLRVLSAMWRDVLEDERAETNPFRDVRIRANDPRIRKAPRVVRVWSWEDMHRFAAAAAAARSGADIDRWRPVYAEAMVRVLSSCGLRRGELLALRYDDFHDGRLEVRRTAYMGRVTDGTKTDHGEVSAGRVVPVPPVLAGMLGALPQRIDTKLLFPAPRGGVWQESSFYRDVWRPAQEATGLAVTPHEMRHSWVSAMRAANIDMADLAKATGHTVETATKHYTHALDRSFEAMRRAVGE